MCTEPYAGSFWLGSVFKVRVSKHGLAWAYIIFIITVFYEPSYPIWSLGKGTTCGYVDAWAKIGHLGVFWSQPLSPGQGCSYVYPN